MLEFLTQIAGPVLDITGSIGGGLIQKNAITKAQRAQEKALGRAETATTGAYNEAKGYQQPYYDVGTQAMRNLSGMVNRGEFNVHPYQYQMQQVPNEQFNFQADPGYQWRMQQGTNAINSNAAAMGNQLSGATLKALAKYGQGLASQEYSNAFDRFNQNRNFAQGQYQFGTQMGMNNALNQYNAANQQANQRYGRFSDLAGYGQNSASNMGNLATGYGQNMSGMAIDRGNVQAQGIMGRGQAYDRMLGGSIQGVQQGIQNYQNQQNQNAQNMMQFLPFLA
jgi:hypothetical protein